VIFMLLVDIYGQVSGTCGSPSLKV